MTTRAPRRVRWLRAAERGFEEFPQSAQLRAVRALRQVALGEKPDIAKPMQGLGSGVWELALRDRGDAFRVVYALMIGDEIWVIHAFQKKSKSGIATPKHEIEVIRQRIKRLKS